VEKKKRQKKRRRRKIPGTQGGGQHAYGQLLKKGSQKGAKNRLEVIPKSKTKVRLSSWIIRGWEGSTAKIRARGRVVTANTKKGKLHHQNKTLPKASAKKGGKTQKAGFHLQTATTALRKGNGDAVAWWL